MSYIKNLAGQYIGFGLVSASDGSAVTGASVTAYIVKDGGAQGTPTGSVTEKGNGQYSFALSQADTNADFVSIMFTATGAVPVEKTIVTTASTALGYVAIDWNAINAPTTTVGLTGTTIATSQVVASVTGAVGSVTGNVGGTVASVVGNVGGNVVGTVASVVGNVGGNVVGTVASVVNVDNVWSVATRVLTAGTNIQLPANGLANVTAWTVDITGSLSGSVGSVTGAVGSVVAVVSANITQVNSIAVQGSGTTVSPWGPV